MIITFWLLNIAFNDFVRSRRFFVLIRKFGTTLTRMGSCLCKEKTVNRTAGSNTGNSHARRHLSVEADQTDSVRSDPGSSTSSGYHGSQGMMVRSASKKTVRMLVLETLSVIRTLIDRSVNMIYNMLLSEIHYMYKRNNLTLCPILEMEF